MNALINNMRIPVRCDCGHEFHECFGWLKGGPDLICPACSRLFSLSREQLREIISTVEESLYRLSFIGVSGEYFSSESAYRKSRQLQRPE